MTQTTENTVSNNSIVVCVFIATGLYLLSHCLAMIRGHGKHTTAAELLKVGFSLQSATNWYKENNSAQDCCHSVHEPEAWKTSFLAPLFQGWHTTNKIVLEGGVDSSSWEQGPVVGYRTQSNELLAFIKYRTFLFTWRITSQLLKNNCAPCSKFIVLVIFWFYIYKQYFQLRGHVVA
jgi:hypothetical protein